jgi:cyanate permease
MDAMKDSVFVLSVTAILSLAGLFIASLVGNREDLGTAVGGVAGFVLAHYTLSERRRPRQQPDQENGSARLSRSPFGAFIYLLFSVAGFSFIGWLTGYVHDHGQLAGALGGGLGGLILATMVPAMQRSSFLSTGRRFQLAMSTAATLALLGIILVMYRHLFQ